MAVIPTGRPVWERASDHTTYGGNVEKKNHLSQGSIDALTDWSAEEFSRLVADFSAVARTAPFAVITYTCNDSSPGAPTIVRVNGMIGVRNTPYVGNAAPTGFPSASRNGNGDVTFTFDGVYLDPYGISGTFVLAHPRATTIGTDGGTAPCERLSDTSVRVRGYDKVGNVDLDAMITLVVNSGS